MNMCEKIFYKYKLINGYTYSSIEDKYFYFSRPDELNDPEDCRIPFSYRASDAECQSWLTHIQANMTVEEFDNFPYNTIEKIKESLNGDEKIKETLDDVPNNVIGRFHLLSLTDSNVHHHMWNHEDYGQNYSGLCIGYKSQKFENVYTIKVHPNQIPQKYQINGGFPIIDVKYDNDRSHCYDIFKEKYDDNNQLVKGGNPSGKNIIYNLFHKTPKWSDEVESRGFYYTLDGLCKVCYSDEVLDSITFGCNANPDEIQKIMKIVEKNYLNHASIKFYKATPDEMGNVIIDSM